MKKLNIVKTKTQLCLDMETRCKRASTAYRRFYNAIETVQKDGAFGGYDLLNDLLIKPDELDWQYNTPIQNDIEGTGYVVGIEELDDDYWYLWISVTRKRMVMQ